MDVSIRPRARPDDEDLAPVIGAPTFTDRDGNVGEVRSPTSGGKGGGRAQVAMNTDAGRDYARQFNEDDSYGYYNQRGEYVSPFTDMRDGGGRNQSGNYFVGGGLLSTIGNLLKVRPVGPASERDPMTGDYIIPRSQIGFTSIADMFDQGGPQASGGGFRDGGMAGNVLNMLNRIGNNESMRRPTGLSVVQDGAGYSVVDADGNIIRDMFPTPEDALYYMQNFHLGSIDYYG